jgi:hypothetical protein
MSIVVTTTPNWNSGMNYILRYATWIYAFIIYFVVLNITGKSLLFFLSIINTIYFICYHYFNPIFSNVTLNNLSKYFLKDAPCMLIMEKETFCEISGQKDGYLKFNKNPYPCTLLDENMYIRKMYTDSKGLNSMLKNKKYYISSKFKKNIETNYLNRKGFFFINIDKNKVFQKYLSYTGSSLPSQVGVAHKNYMEINNSTQGFITYGPYVTLPKGNYKFEVSYISSEPYAKKSGKWDVVVSGKVLNNGDIYGSCNTNAIISDYFNISEKYSNKKIEIRNYYNGVGSLVIKNLTIRMNK